MATTLIPLDVLVNSMEQRGRALAVCEVFR